jgi:hypothetical protein
MSLKERIIDNLREFQEAQLDLIVNSVRHIYEGNGRPVKILDLATGPNELNPAIVLRLMEGEIDYELVLSDISPQHFKIGHELLRQSIPPEEMRKIKCVLADIRDLTKPVTEVPIWGEGNKPIEEVLKDKRFSFLSTGYEGARRIVSFEEGSFDMIIGEMPYGSAEIDSFGSVVKNVLKTLREGGYHIVTERQLEKLNPEIPRSERALRYAREKAIDLLQAESDKHTGCIAVYSRLFGFFEEKYEKDRLYQNGDILKESMLAHKKEERIQE